MHPSRRLGGSHKAHELVMRCHRATGEAQWERDQLLVTQIRRAALEVAACIADGAGRESPAQFARALESAIGAARELDYLLLVSRELNLLNLHTHATLEARALEVVKMLVALRKTVRRRESDGHKGKGRPRLTSPA